MSALSLPYINTIGVTSHGKALCVFTASLLPPAFYTCMSVHGGGGGTWAGTPPGRYTQTPRQVPPLGRYNPQVGIPPGRYTPLGRYHLGRYTTQIGTPPGQVHPPDIYTPRHSACWDTVNKRPVRIPPECILVLKMQSLHWTTKIQLIYIAV